MAIALAAFIPDFSGFLRKGENECKFFAYLYLSQSVRNHLILFGVTLLFLYIIEKAKEGQTVLHDEVGEQLFPLGLIC